MATESELRAVHSTFTLAQVTELIRLHSRVRRFANVVASVLGAGGPEFAPQPQILGRCPSCRDGLLDLVAEIITAADAADSLIPEADWIFEPHEPRTRRHERKPAASPVLARGRKRPKTRARRLAVTR